MDITPYVDGLRRDLTAAAEAAGPEARAAADRMALALEPAVRLALLEALSQAAAEITSELDAGTVDVRLRGREPELVVDVPTSPVPPEPPTAPAPPTAAAPPSAEEEDEGDVARITLRLPESVKYRAEELAAKGGHSLNSWIVNAIRAATRDRAVTVDIDLSSIERTSDALPGRGRGPRRMTGWV